MQFFKSRKIFLPLCSLFRTPQLFRSVRFITVQTSISLLPGVERAIHFPFRYEASTAALVFSAS